MSSAEIPVTEDIFSTDIPLFLFVICILLVFIHENNILVSEILA